MAMAYFALGRKVDSVNAIVALEKQFSQTNPLDIAEVHAYRREIDLVSSGLIEPMHNVIEECRSSKTNSLLRRVHSDPLYEAFLRKMKLPDNNIHACYRQVPRYHVQLAMPKDRFYDR